MLTKRMDKMLSETRNLRGTIVSVYCEAIEKHYTSDRIIELLNFRVYENYYYKRLPGWAQNQLRGVADGCGDMLYRMHLTWKVYVDGKYYTKEEMTSLEIPYSSCVSDMGNHFWNNSEDPYGKTEIEHKAERKKICLEISMDTTKPLQERFKAAEELGGLLTNEEIARAEIPWSDMQLKAFRIYKLRSTARNSYNKLIDRFKAAEELSILTSGEADDQTLSYFNKRDTKKYIAWVEGGRKEEI